MVISTLLLLCSGSTCQWCSTSACLSSSACHFLWQLLHIEPPTYSLFQTLSHQGSTPLRGGWMLGDTPLCSDAPKPFPAPSESIPILTFSLHYKCPWMDYSQPLQKPAGSNLELDPSKPFLLIIHLSIYFMFSSCFIFKLSATYIVWLYLSRDLSFSFRIPC